MAVFDNLSDRTKQIIVAVIGIIDGAFLAFAQIFGWDLQLYQSLVAVAVLLLDVFLGIYWAPRKRDVT